MKINPISYYQNNNLIKSVQYQTPVTVIQEDSFVKEAPAFKAGKFSYNFLEKYKIYRSVGDYFTNAKIPSCKDRMPDFTKKAMSVLQQAETSWPQRFKDSLDSALSGKAKDINLQYASRFLVIKYLAGNNIDTDLLQNPLLQDAAVQVLKEGRFSFCISSTAAQRENVVSLCNQLGNKDKSLQLDITNPEDLLVYLQSNPDIDRHNSELWSRAISNGYCSHLLSKFSQLKDFDINRIKFDDEHSILTKLLERELSNKYPMAYRPEPLIKLYPDLDTNYCPPGKLHLLYQVAEKCTVDIIDRDLLDIFKLLYEHPKTDRSITNTRYFNCLISKLRTGTGYQQERYNEILSVITNYADNDYVNKIRSIYKREGTFTLDEMSKIVSYGNFNKFANMSVNELGERFGHIIAEIYIDKENPEQINKMTDIVKKLSDNMYAFNATDDLGVSPLEKAIKCNNEVVANLLRNYSVKL